jgi:hypothetical protein
MAVPRQEDRLYLICRWQLDAMALLMLCIATATRRIETRQFSSSLYLATGKSRIKIKQLVFLNPTR